MKKKIVTKAIHACASQYIGNAKVLYLNTK